MKTHNWIMRVGIALSDKIKLVVVVTEGRR